MRTWELEARWRPALSALCCAALPWLFCLASAAYRALAGSFPPHTNNSTRVVGMHNNSKYLRTLL